MPWAQDILLAIENGDVHLEDYELSQWRLMHIGAQPVPQSLIKKWKEIFPNHQYDTNYGLSESIGPGAVHLGVENIHKVGAIGVPGYGWQAKIVNEDGTEVEQGAVGGAYPQGTWCHDLLLQESEGDRGVPEGRLAVHRRYGYAGRRWIYLSCR